MRDRISKIVLALDMDGSPITVEDVGVAGAAAVLMKDTIEPTLMQTLEGTPVFVHAGPFANIAHGNSSIMADMIGLKLADYVITESGFGSDMGMEKFFDIKCQSAGLSPKVVVLTTTIRALKYHGGADLKNLTEPDCETLTKGLPNLEKHLENIKQFNVTPVIAINKLGTPPYWQHLSVDIHQPADLCFLCARHI